MISVQNFRKTELLHVFGKIPLFRFTKLTCLFNGFVKYGK